MGGSYLDTPPQQEGFHLEDGMEEQHATLAAKLAYTKPWGCRLPPHRQGAANHADGLEIKAKVTVQKEQTYRGAAEDRNMQTGQGKMAQAAMVKMKMPLQNPPINLQG